MDVIQVSEDFYPETSGGAFEDWETAKGIADAGHRVVVVTPRLNKTPSVEYKEGVEIRRPFTGWSNDNHATSLLGMVARIKFCILATIYLIRLTRVESFDVVYTTNHGVHPVGRLVSLWRGLPLINSIAYSPSINPDDRRLSNPFYLIEQVNFQYCMGDVVFCRTPSVREIVSKRANTEVRLVDGVLQTNKIRNTIQSYRQESHDSDCADYENNVLVFVGRLDKNKNPKAAIEVVAELSGYRLVIIGDGPQKENLEAVAEKLGVEDKVEILGQCDHQSTLQIIHDADALLLTSHVEAYPTVVFEALAVRTPVISTPVGALTTVSHPQLTLNTVDQMPASISTLSRESSSGLDEEVLELYSINHFVMEVKSAMIAVSENSATGLNSS